MCHFTACHGEKCGEETWQDNFRSRQGKGEAETGKTQVRIFASEGSPRPDQEFEEGGQKPCQISENQTRGKERSGKDIILQEKVPCYAELEQKGPEERDPEEKDPCYAELEDKKKWECPELKEKWEWQQSSATAA
jgi:hypothetical protein